MLKVPSEFPHAGSTAYVSPHGEAVRIIQRNEDGSFLLARKRHPSIHADASDTFRAEPETVHSTEAAAIGLKPKRRRRAA